MGVAELRRLRQLEDENRKLKPLVADLSWDKHMLQDVLKKVVKPAPKRSSLIPSQMPAPNSGSGNDNITRHILTAHWAI